MNTMSELEEQSEPPEVDVEEIGPGNFERLRKIGAGDVGRVYIVRHKDSGNLYAMKVLSKEEMVKRKKIQRCITERDVLSHVDHPCIVSLYFTFNTGRFLYFVMDYCAGGEFFRMLRKQPGARIPEDWVRFYAAEVLMALQYLHSIGFIYRDLKPENILLHQTGHIMLTDFDLAARAEASAPEVVKRSSWSKFKHAISGHHKDHSGDMIFHSVEPMVSRNSFVGTPEYIAPEVIVGNGHTGAVDWWTFGVLIFEMTYGKTPYCGRTEQITFSKIANEDEKLKFPEQPIVSPALKKLMKKLLKRNVKKRLGAKFGASDIMKTPFFEGVKWQLIRNMTPPYVPDLHGELDTSAFTHVAARDYDPELDEELPWSGEITGAASTIDAHEQTLLNKMISSAMPASAGAAGAAGGGGGGAAAAGGKTRERFLSCPQVVVGSKSTPAVSTPTSSNPTRERFQSQAIVAADGSDPFATFGHSVAYRHNRHEASRAVTVAPVDGCSPSTKMLRSQSDITFSPLTVSRDAASPPLAQDPQQQQQPQAAAAMVTSKPKRTAVLFYAVVPKSVQANHEFILSVLAVKESATAELSGLLPSSCSVGGTCGPFLLHRHMILDLNLQLSESFPMLGQNPEHLTWTGQATSSKVDFWVRAASVPGDYSGCIRVNLGESSHTLGFAITIA